MIGQIVKVRSYRTLARSGEEGDGLCVHAGRRKPHEPTGAAESPP